MSLAAGTRLGAYEIIELIGVGGMGEVYRARDAKLKRDVAVKILPEDLAAEPARISRFEREAELLASLNHTNIAIVHDFQQADRRHFLVMELVDGETLADRLKRGPLPLDETLQIAKQIAEALEAAHQKGIIHRDLKPGNIKIVPDGKVKVLDFGLAKIFGTDTDALDTSNSPTVMSATGGGVILGTAAYMSPEQARGKAIDKRTDIWALGCVIYEALTGKQAFAGDNISDTIAAIIRGEPDWSALPPEVSRPTRTLLERCLRKDPRQRLHDAADVRIELDDASTVGEVAGSPPRQTGSRQFLLIGIVLAAGLAIASVFWWLRALPSALLEPIHVTVTLSSDAVPAGGDSLYEPFTISPDGKWLVYTVIRDGKSQLLLRSIQEFDGKLIAGTEGGSVPFFSPDSQWIGFGAGKELKKVAVSGGSPVVICTCLNAFLVGAWGADNRIIFVPDFNLGIWTVPAGGGTPSQLLKTDETKDRIAYTYVQLLPENNGILLAFASAQTINADDEKIAVLEPGAAEPRIIVQGSNPRYLPTGNLVYVRGGSLLSVGFDLSRLALTGTPVTLIDGIERNVTGDSEYAVSQNGTLVYEPATGIQSSGRFVMVDRKGSVRPIAERRGAPADFSLSRDGKSIAARLIAINDDIWTYDVSTGTPTRLTFEPFDELSPQWTPDGTRIAFSTRTGKIYWKPADGSAPREELSAGEYPRKTGSFSPDGKTLAFVESHPARRGDIWLMSLDDRKAQPFLATDADESAPRFSPDGHFLAYVSDETGRNEIYIRPIGSAGGRKRISTEGGNWPAWARNGKELFFLRGDKLDKLASVTLDAQANAIGRDRILLDAPALDDLVFTGNGPVYDVMPDGEHFVMVLRPHYASASHYNVIVNWFEELRRKTSSR